MKRVALSFIVCVLLHSLSFSQNEENLVGKVDGFGVKRNFKISSEDNAILYVAGISLYDSISSSDSVILKLIKTDTITTIDSSIVKLFRESNNINQSYCATGPHSTNAHIPQLVYGIKIGNKCIE